MATLKEMNWENPLKAVPVVDEQFDDMYGTEVLEITLGNIIDLMDGVILYVVVEGEYALLIRLEGGGICLM